MSFRRKIKIFEELEAQLYRKGIELEEDVLELLTDKLTENEFDVIYIDKIIKIDELEYKYIYKIMREAYSKISIFNVNQ